MTGRPALTLSEAADATGGRVLGDESTAFRRVAPVHDAGPEDLAMLADRRYASDLQDCYASALLISETHVGLEGGPADRLVVPDPREALVTLLALLHPAPEEDWGVHRSAVIHPEAVVHEQTAVGPNAVIGAGSTLERGVRIGANCVVGERVDIGEDTILFPSVTIYADAVLGRRVIVHAGSRIGVDGFGYALVDGAHTRIPQVGSCLIEDDVEIGANCTIDRGSIGNTRIGAGSKLDNLVHIGHNVEVGRGSLVVAQAGIAGSTRMGDGVAVGGQAGIVGHLKIGAGARIGAQAGVISDVAPGNTVSGYPARNHRTYLRAMARLMRLPEVVKRVERLERSLAGAVRGPSPGDPEA